MKYLILLIFLLSGLYFLKGLNTNPKPQSEIRAKQDIKSLRKKVNESINKNLKLSTAEKSYQKFKDKNLKLKAQVEGLKPGQEDGDILSDSDSYTGDVLEPHATGIESDLRTETHTSSSSSPDDWSEFVKKAKADGWDVIVDANGEISVRESQKR